MRSAILVTGMLIAHALKAPELASATNVLLWALFGFCLTVDVWDFLKSVLK